MLIKISPGSILRNIAALFVVLIATAIVMSCNSSVEHKTVSEETFPVIQPVLIDTTYNKQYVAEIKSLQNIELRAKFKGYIEKVFVDEGQFVKEGQILFTLNNREYKLEVLKTQSQLKSKISDLRAAQEELNNTRQLVEKNILSPSELAMAKAKVDAIQSGIDEANANIATAKLNLSFTTIKAPFSGTINSIPNKAGSLVEENTLLTTISNNTEVFAYFTVSEKEFLDFRENNQAGKDVPVSLLLANNKLLKQAGKIETVMNELDNSSGTIAFRARFANPDNLLRHGSSASVLLPVKMKNVMLIPQKSTFEVQDKTYVYVLDAGNKTVQKEISVTSGIPNFYAVSSGLSVRDKIVYEGIQNVKEGVKITPSLLSFHDVVSKLKTL
jgi:membrane fusion protein (multidrug efflux system)